MKIFKRAAKLFQKNGGRKLKRRIEENRRIRHEAAAFQKWLRGNRINDEQRASMRGETESFERKPLVSVLVPVYDVEEKWLRRCIESVTKQIYENWELCIADDCSPSPHIRRVLEEYARLDERIKIVFREANGHISAASNSALEIARGEFVALLDHDDELAEDALFHVAKELKQFPDADFIYSDEDKIDENGAKYEPQFKPDFSLDFLRSVNYVTHLAVYRTALLRKIGGFRLGFEGSQDYDLALRAVERVPANQIRHIPRILYHWRAIRGSVALGGGEKPYAHERARAAIRQHLERSGKRATVQETVYNLHRVCYELPANLPKINLFLRAGNDWKVTLQAIENFTEQTNYADFEIAIITREKTDLPDAISPARNVKLIVCDENSEAGQFNFAVRQTVGEILCFADANLKPLAENWLSELTAFIVQNEIGAVGGKILDFDETILHAGSIIGAGDAAGHAHENFSRENGGYLMRARLINNFSAVSVSCLVTRRETFESSGGFDAENFPERFFDADFCLRLRERNLRVVYTPYAELVKVNQKRRLNFEKNPTAVEKQNFAEKWEKIVERDPFYNPNLSKKDARFSIDV